MLVKMKTAVLTLTAVGLLVVGLGLFAGSTAGANATPSATGVSSGAAVALSGSAGHFNFSKNGPVWDTGNLCVVQVSGSYLTCSYTGSSYHYHGAADGAWGGKDCGCSQPTSLIYNFSLSHDTLNISLANLSKKVQIYINVEGEHNTININITGCGKGGSLNVSVLGEYDQVNFVNSASGVSSSFAIYENHDGYAATISGSWDKTRTIFAGAAPKDNYCPWKNVTRNKDTLSVSFTGYGDAQKFVWAQGNGYSTLPSLIWVGHFNTITFENTSTFSCYWSLPSPSTCHHGWGSQAVLLATSRD